MQVSVPANKCHRVTSETPLSKVAQTRLHRTLMKDEELWSGIRKINCKNSALLALSSFQARCPAVLVLGVLTFSIAQKSKAEALFSSPSDLGIDPVLETAAAAAAAVLVV